MSGSPHRDDQPRTPADSPSTRDSPGWLDDLAERTAAELEDLEDRLLAERFPTKQTPVETEEEQVARVLSEREWEQALSTKGTEWSPPDDWFDGRPRELIRGEDFTIRTEAYRQKIQKWHANHDDEYELQLVTRDKGQRILLRILERQKTEPEPPAEDQPEQRRGLARPVRPGEVHVEGNLTGGSDPDDEDDHAKANGHTRAAPKRRGQSQPAQGGTRLA